MDIIDKSLPLNSREKIDTLIKEIKKIPNGMNLKVRDKIFLNINKRPVITYFSSEYPESAFFDALVDLPKISSNADATSMHLPEGTLASNKYIYGTYIEMALHNLFLNVEHIFAVVFGRNIMEEASENFMPTEKKKYWDDDFANEQLVWNPMFAAFKNARHDEALKIEEMMNRHFPMLVRFKDFTQNSNDYNGYNSIDLIRSASQLLRILRNVYSHYKIELSENQENTYLYNEVLICECLDNCFIDSRHVVKERFAFDDNAMKCTEQYKLWDKGQDNKKHLTPFGLVFFTCLFLEKKYAKVMSDKLKLVAKQDQSVVCEMLSVYRVRLNSQRIKVTKYKEALALDIINELQRCPKELFEILTPAGQSRFRVQSIDENIRDVLMVRHSDRFPQLVMKYIDDAHLFSNIRFQVSLGKYFYRFYDKKCIDSNTRVRAICKNVNGFGRIEEIELMRQGRWNDVMRQYEDVHKNTADEKPYVTDHHAQYAITENRIGMRIMEDEVNSYLPELATNGACNLAPSCWLSVYELPAMMFLILLRDGAYVEDIIKSTVANYRKFFADVEQGKILPVCNEEELSTILQETYGIESIKDIPKNMSDYLLGKTHDTGERFRKFAVGLLDTLIEQTEYKLQTYREDKKLIASNTMENKIGKRSSVQLKPGVMASFLAKDIMFFQPNNEENTYKLTGLNYRVLQAVLATYTDRDTDTLKRTLRSAHIMGDKDNVMCNPIVQRIMSKPVIPENTMDFYESYLQERLAYLKECKHTGTPQTLYFLHGNRLKWQEHDAEFSRQQAGRYLRDVYRGNECEKGIELPRGMFERYIREKLNTIAPMRVLAEDMSKNVSYLIYAYFMKVINDDCQSMYEMNRSYRLFNVLYRKSPRDAKQYRTAEQIRLMLNRKHATSVYKDIEHYIKGVKSSEQKQEREKLNRLLTSIKNTETDLKRYKIQDMLLLLIAKKVFMSNVDDAVQQNAFEKLKLKDILNGESLKQKIRFTITVPSKNGYPKTIRKDNLMLKHYANVYQILSDRRLPALLDLVRARVIEHSYIESELSGYDKVHPEIIKDVFDFEKEYYQQNPNGSPTDFGNMVYQSTQYDEDKKKSLRKTRNAFAHNTYPKYWDVQIAGETELPKKAIAISAKFKSDLKNEE
ncbi:MAG: type VI-B CRISPR-associated RNA-guided ribonuclease Cas13b [Prevotella sp.]|nr:type VI-B CRISPR-associated RNA-guided ribonuclease Cas13b [Candidatus Prevotella equi]